MFDVIIIGARCAGSPTAMLLARQGYDVLLVDRATFPSDHAQSTHVVWQDGGERLARWGLFEAATAACPPIERFTIDLGPFALTGSPPPAGTVVAAHAPRRALLDKVLVDAAVGVGVALRERCTLEGLVVEDGGVVGARLRGPAGETVVERASLVVGADGAHSLVARQVDAPVRDERPVYQGTSWSYWSGVPVDGLELYVREHMGAYAFPTDDGLTLVGVNAAADGYASARRDVAAHHGTVLAQVAPGLAERVAAGEREDRWCTGATANVVRKPWGPGWALVGDAGCFKDPCTARGISDAFRDAELLADAIHRGLAGGGALSDALAQFERRRDEATLPTFEFTCQLAPFDPPTPEMLALFGALRGNQAQIDRFWGVLAGTVPVQDFFSPDSVAAIMAAA
ncbi:MAG: NAD(P)/FAD-dependent oxidoreductase [Acidimicrobiales bacterium]